MFASMIATTATRLQLPHSGRAVEEIYYNLTEQLRQVLTSEPSDELVIDRNPFLSGRNRHTCIIGRAVSSGTFGTHPAYICLICLMSFGHK